MANIPLVAFPHCNPIQFVRLTNARDYFFDQSIPSFEHQVSYYQRYQTSDYIMFQVNVNVSIVNKYAIICQLKSCSSGLVYGTFQLSGDQFTYGSYRNLTYKLTLYNPLIPAGDYYVELYTPHLNSSNFDLFASEPVNIATVQENTILIEYTNDGCILDTFFYTDHNYITKRYFQYRVEGGFRSDGYVPSFESANFIDQTHNPVQLHCVPYETRELTIGDNIGVPNYQIKKVNFIMSCDEFYIDDVRYCKADGAGFAKKELATLHPKNAWRIALMQTDNQFSDYHRFIFEKVNDGIGTAIIGDTFIIQNNTNTVITATPLDPIMKPNVIPLPHIPAMTETEIFHNLAATQVDWQFYDIINGCKVNFSLEKQSDSNPTNAITVESEVEIPAGQIVCKVIRLY